MRKVVINQWKFCFCSTYSSNYNYLQFVIQGRSVCRGCHGPITKGTLRLANLVQVNSFKIEIAFLL